MKCIKRNRVRDIEKPYGVELVLVVFEDWSEIAENADADMRGQEMIGN